MENQRRNDNSLKDLPLFQSKQLEYRDVTIFDTGFISSMMLDKETMAYIPNKYKEEYEIKEMIERIEDEKELEDRTVFFFVLREKETCRPVGLVNIKRMKINEKEKGILGYIINKDFCGKGYATESTKKMIEYGFDILNIPEITASTAVDNIASEKILKKLGMRKVEVVKDGLDVNGKYYDEVKYILEK